MNFSVAMIASVLEQNADETEQRCFALASRGALFRNEGTTEWPDGTASAAFAFAHSLYQEVLYEQVPPGRRANLHRHIGRRLEQALAADASAKASLLAFHFDAGRDYDRAVSYLCLAAQGALRKNGHREAVTHLRRALDLIKTLPQSPETEVREFTVLSLLAPTLIRLEGFAAPGADRHYQRARELGQKLGNQADMHQLLFSLAMTHELRGEYRITEQILRERLELPGPVDETSVLVDSDSLMACSLFHQGKFSQALERAEHGLDLYDPEKHVALLAVYGENPGAACNGWASLCLWFLGYVDQAVERLHTALEHAEKPERMHSLCFTQIQAAHVYQLRREPDRALDSAQAAWALADAQGYVYPLAFAKVVKGWVMVERGQRQEGLDLIDEGIAVASSISAKLDHPYLLALSAEAKARVGDVSAALKLIAEAFTLVRNSRTFFYEAELHRLNAAFKMMLDMSNTGAAEADLQTAIDIARKQGAKSLELRAAIDLCQLRREQDLVKSVYASFKEGFATEDLKRARELLAR
jgi:adenylate cyclase